MTGNPDTGKNHANQKQILPYYYRNKRKSLQIVVKGKNTCSQNGNRKAGENILSIILIDESRALFPKELPGNYQRKTDAYDRYEIISVDYFHAFFLP